jgi:spore germination protein YaaH
MRVRKWLAVLLVLSALVAVPNAAFGAGKTTKYRVYQKETALSEFSDLKQAIAYAGYYANSYVEEIGTRRWVWNNLPRYRLYQFDTTLSDWGFATLGQAKATAQYYGYVSIRDLQKPGWVWHNYPRYRLYQGGITLDRWEFVDLQDAIAEAAYYLNAHVIDLYTNEWVWDNIAPDEEERQRQGAKKYEVRLDGKSEEDWKFGFLGDAVATASKLPGAIVVDTSDGGKTVYANESRYKVYQNDNLIQSFASLDEAIAYAQWYLHIRIELDGREIWNNYPYYQVYQHDNLVAEFNTIEEALQFSQWYKYISIRTYDGDRIWNNDRQLLFWGWNGASADETIISHVQTTAGLDVDSPTWFQLGDASGKLLDTSNKKTVDWLKSQGIAVHPLVGNQFDTDLTNRFLADETAQQTFIRALVDKAAALGVDGLNLDFENVAGHNRVAFTAFVASLTEAAHAKGLLVSIDLPRGSVKWNHQTAFDHEKLGAIVDYIVTMAYDQYYSGSAQPGSVSGLSWAEEGVKEFLDYGIPRDKLILGIPFYVREWKIAPDGKLESNRAIYMKDVPALVAAKKAVAAWDPAFGQYRVEYEEDGYRYVFWLEDEQTVRARLDIAKTYDLAGVAAWRLGYETRDVWNTMLTKK